MRYNRHRMPAVVGPVVGALQSVVGWYAGLGSVAQLAIQSGVLAAGAIYSHDRASRAARLAREASRDAAARSLRQTPAGSVVPRAYGYAYVPGVPAYRAVGRNLPYAEGEFGALAAGSGERLEYLLHQQVFCAGGISKVACVLVNESLPIDDAEYSAHVRCDSFTNGMAGGSDMATRFTGGQYNGIAGTGSGERAGTATFTGLAGVTVVFRHDPDNPVWPGEPYLGAFVHGQEVQTVTAANELAADHAFRRTMPLVLLDYLLDVGLTDADIDLASIRAAHTVADVVVQDAAGGSQAVRDAEVPQELLDLYGQNWRDYTAWYADPNFGVDATAGMLPSCSLTTAEAAAAELHRYEYNGLAGGPDVVEEIQKILSAVPGSEFFRSPTGRWKLSVADWLATAADQSVGTVTDDVLLEPPSVVYPEAATKLNQATVIFPNINRDFAEDSVTWPEIDSAADTALLRRDEGERLTTDYRPYGVVNRFHAISLAANNVLISRRARYAWIQTPGGYLLEPGDVVRLRSVTNALDEYVRITTVAVRDDLNVQITGYEFRPGDHAWITTSAESVIPGPNITLAPERPQSLAVARSGNAVTLRWTADSDESAFVARYELQVQFDSGDWQALTETSRGVRTYEYVIDSNDHVYKYRVRSVNIAGRTSAWLESSTLRYISVSASAPSLAFSGDTVEIEASVDGDNAGLTVDWRLISGPTVTILNGDTLTPTFVAPTFSASTPGIALSAIILSVAEGAEGTFRVRLLTEPTGDVTLAVSSADTNAVTVDPDSLMFTADNWDTRQTVTVMGETDADSDDEEVIVRLEASGGGYDDVVDGIVRVTVDDA